MEEDFLAWHRIGDNIVEHVIMDKVKDKPIFRLEGDGCPAESDSKQMRFDMSRGDLQAGALGTLFSSADDDSAAWKKTPRKIGMKMVRLLENPVFSQRAWFCCLEMAKGG